MATLIPALNSCLRRMTTGEKRFAQRLESLLEDDYLCWYDVAIGNKHQHPDFVILHPRRGLLVLEIKDWKLDDILSINRVSVSLGTLQGLKELANPLEQARQYAFSVKNRLETDPALIAPEGHRHQGKLLFPYGYGVVLAEITRKQFDASDLGEVMPAHLTICKDEMTNGAEAEEFQKRLWDMFNVQFPPLLTMPQIDRIRWHLFPEIRISQGGLFEASDATELVTSATSTSETIVRVMDLNQEQMARNLGEGHRVIHGVAGSGKTLILGYRCAHLARTLNKPILVLCFNVALASKLEQVMIARGLQRNVSVRSFHRWCLEQLELYHVVKPQGSGDSFYEQLVATFIGAVETGQIPRAQYGAVMIDEGHDFESAWLTLVTQMIDPETNSLLLLYDDAQSIYGKKRPARFSFKSLGIQAQGRTSILRVNYRNTNEILDCAYAFAKDVLKPEDAEDDGVPVVKPEMAGRHGPVPQVIQARSISDEASRIRAQLQTLHDGGRPWNEMAVLYPAAFIGQEILTALQRAQIPAEWLQRSSASRRYDAAADTVKVMTIHSSKGLEFPVVAIAGIGHMPYREEQASAEARLLYVGMTRATEMLVMTASRKSEFVMRLTRGPQIAA